ncbi:MAG: hypothetical protein ABW095_10910 [Candidatus Thiodiazotropha sp.]
MGGIGSGRHWHIGAKDTIDDYRSIDVRQWKRDGFLIPHKSFRWQWSDHGQVVASIRVRIAADRVIFSYSYRNSRGNWKDVSYPIHLEWTDCNLGGQRPWFLCPAQGCGRRVAILYLGGEILACRHCYQLAYPSQREPAYDRAIRRADKIRDRLGWKKGAFNPKGWQKPKGMHWQTFKRLNKTHDDFVKIALMGIDQQINYLGGPFDD